MVKREPDSRGRLPGIGKKRRWGRPVKRKFYGNKKKEKKSAAEGSASTSSIKQEENLDIQSEENHNLSVKQEENVDMKLKENHKIIDINILFPQLEKMVSCNKCHGKMKITNFDENGLGFKIKIICEQQCQQETIVNSFKLDGPEAHTASTVALQVLGLS